MNKEQLIELMQFMIRALEATEDDCKIDEYQRTLAGLGEEE